jgi:hypothetical protein
MEMRNSVACVKTLPWALVCELAVHLARGLFSHGSVWCGVARKRDTCPLMQCTHCTVPCALRVTARVCAAHSCDLATRMHAEWSDRRANGSQGRLGCHS